MSKCVTYEKLTDYTIDEQTDLNNNSSNPTLHRIFNFLARNVTVLYERGHSGGFTSQLQIQDFRDFSSTAEIAFMHQKLLDLDGHPPPLADILGEPDKRHVTAPSSWTSFTGRSPGDDGP